MSASLKRTFLWGLLLPLPILITLGFAYSLFTFFQLKPAKLKTPLQAAEFIKTDCLDKQQKGKYGDQKCLLDSVRRATEQSDPNTVLSAIELLAKSTDLPYIIDPHLLSHEVGKEIAKSYGINPEAFSKCTKQFNWGCYHGFFIFATEKEVSLIEAAEKTCGALSGQGMPKAAIDFCFHGVGHAIMMNLAYDLKGSLETCDKLTSSRGQSHCWQGAFMENELAGKGGYAKEGIFLEEDPMAPCNKLEEKYKHQCYANQSSYLLVRKADFSIIKTAKLCSLAEKPYVEVCVLGAGLMASTEAWHPLLAETQGFSGTAVEATAHICNLIPKNLRTGCITGSSMNFVNNKDADEAFSFCNLIDKSSRSACFRQAGTTLAENYPDLSLLRETCRAANEWMKECMQGAMSAL